MLFRYILTSDLGLRTECCFLSGYFFKALFRSSLPHPTADRDYALYEVGEGCEVTNLVPGVDLMSDRFRCDGRTLVAALRFVMDELGRGKHGLFVSALNQVLSLEMILVADTKHDINLIKFHFQVLPLLTLYQYLTTFVCRDLQRNVDGRILKVRVLTDMGLFSEAFTVLQVDDHSNLFVFVLFFFFLKIYIGALTLWPYMYLNDLPWACGVLKCLHTPYKITVALIFVFLFPEQQLLNGDRLPHTADSNFRQLESRSSAGKFDSSKPILDPSNLKAKFIFVVKPIVMFRF